MKKFNDILPQFPLLSSSRCWEFHSAICASSHTLRYLKKKIICGNALRSDDSKLYEK